MNIHARIPDVDELKEDFDIEAKLCRGKDGQGALFFSGQHPIPRGDAFEVPASQPPSISSEHKTESSEHIQQMMQRFEGLRSTRRAQPTIIREALLAICAGHWVSTVQLAAIIGRSELTVRTHYVNRLLDEGKLEMRFANLRNHPGQKYRTTVIR